MTAAEVAVTAERPMSAGGQREEDELRRGKGSVGGSMRLRPAPGNRGHMTNQVSQMCIYRPRRNREALL